MIADHTPYPAYKDSGVEWLEREPEHWEWQGVDAGDPTKTE